MVYNRLGKVLYTLRYVQQKVVELSLFIKTQLIIDLLSEFNKVAFFQNFRPVFERDGYEFLPLLNQFRKQTDSGFTNLIITPTVLKDVIYFDISFGSRLNLVEDTIRPYMYGLKGSKAEQNTALTSYGKYHGNKNLRLKAKSVQELTAVMQEIKHFFQQEGLVYLTKLRDIRKLDQLFNAEPDRESELAFSAETRCFRGITIATLCQNPQWQKINRSYIQTFEREGTPSVIVDNYHRLTGFLSNSGLN